MDRRRRAPSYEEDMTPPRGMRGFRSNAVPTDEPMPGRPADEGRSSPAQSFGPPRRSFEEDMTPPRGMRGFRPEMVPTDEPPPGRPSRMAKGGTVKPNYGSTEDIVGHGKTKSAAKADYARKMKAVGLKPKGMAAGGAVASKRADGCAARGKTKGRMV